METASELVPLPASQRQFGRYHLLYRIGTGGMANLYLARFTGPDGFEKLVAIKRIHEHLSAQSSFLKMFKDEARLAARISHPNVVQVIELGEYQGSYYIAMEYVDGENLTALLNRTKLELPIAARIIADALAGLHAAHELRNVNGELVELVHRDLSPSNILIGYDGAVKVVDFGVARARGTLHVTEAGMVKGKFAYMSPEQVNNQNLDRRSDIFSMGILLYEASTYSRLFRGESDAASVALILAGDVPAPSRRMPGYPASLEKLAMKALAHDRGKRFATAREMQAALEQYIYSSGSPVPSSSVGDLMRRVFRERISSKGQLLQSSLINPETIPDALEQSNTLRLPIAEIQIKVAAKARAKAEEVTGPQPEATKPTVEVQPVTPTPSRGPAGLLADRKSGMTPTPSSSALPARPAQPDSPQADRLGSRVRKQAAAGTDAAAPRPDVLGSRIRKQAEAAKPGEAGKPAAGAVLGKIPTFSKVGAGPAPVIERTRQSPTAAQTGPLPLLKDAPAPTAPAINPVQTGPVPLLPDAAQAARAVPIVPQLPGHASTEEDGLDESTVELGADALEEVIEPSVPSTMAEPAAPAEPVATAAPVEVAAPPVAALHDEDLALPGAGRRRMLLIVVAGVAIAAVLGIWLAVRKTDPDKPLVAPQQKTVQVTVRVSPAAANIVVDGKPAANPCELRREQGSAGAKLRITAAGYRSQDLDVSFERDRTLEVKLQARPPDAGQPDLAPPDQGRVAAAKPDAGKKIRRPYPQPKTKTPDKKGGKGLFGNPYED